MDLNIKIKDASSKDIEQLLKTIAPTRSSDYQLPPAAATVQDVSSSIETQAMMRSIAGLTQVVEGLVAAQQHQSSLPPQRVEVQYRQPQLEGSPVFPAITPAPTEGARYQTQPLAQTTIQAIADETPGYVMPGWMDKLSNIGIVVLIGGILGFVALQMIPKPTIAPEAKPVESSSKPVPSSANLLKVPAQKPPSNPTAPPPADVLKFLPAIK